MGTELAIRILDGFPSGSYSLAAFLRLCDVVESDEVPTAAVTCERQPRLLLNPAFVAAHAPTPQKLLMVVMHELQHVLLGHTKLLRRVTAVDNFVFDAVINGLVCRMFPRPEYTALFVDFYGHDDFPSCLLAPPPGWRTDAQRTPAGIQALPTRLRRRAAEVHRALYSEGGASYEEVRQLLPSVLLRLAKPGPGGLEQLLGAVPLLGSHGDGSGAESDVHPSDLMRDVLRDLVDSWPGVPSPLRGQSLAAALAEAAVTPAPRRTRRQQLRRLIERVADPRLRPAAGPRSAIAPSEGTTPLPSLARRSLVQRALGHTPLLHDGLVPRRRPAARGERAHIYLDVSGSMLEVLPVLYGAIDDCRDLVHPQLHVFSTQVVDVTLQELRRGRCPTTGGTDIRCVAEHMQRHGVGRAVIVTDGFVGVPQGPHLETLRRAKLGVAWLGRPIRTADLLDVADHTCLVEAEEAR